MMRKPKCAMNDNTVLFSSLLLDACIVPVSVPVCHLDSRQQQPPLLNNQHLQQYQQNNPPHLAYQQANHHSYTTVTTSNQHGPSVMGPHNAHQQGPVPPHLQQQVSLLSPIIAFYNGLRRKMKLFDMPELYFSIKFFVSAHTIWFFFYSFFLVLFSIRLVTSQPT